MGAREPHAPSLERLFWSLVIAHCCAAMVCLDSCITGMKAQGMVGTWALGVEGEALRCRGILGWRWVLLVTAPCWVSWRDKETGRERSSFIDSPLRLLPGFVTLMPVCGGKTYHSFTSNCYAL